jgi:radical SAM superfamily enzyme YgiQ (UPF0313 family)
VDLIGRIYRPPSEAHSLLLQVTLGCSHNRCVYCDMYRDKRFRPKDWDTIEADIEEAAKRGPVFERVFLCDGDALILPTQKLLRILDAIRARLPWVTRVGTYGDTRSMGRKTIEELTQLRDAGLGIVYHGMESGDDEVLARIDKGGTRSQCIESARKLKDAGIQHSVIVLLGIGGKALSEQHASGTASVLTEMDPPYVGALTTTVIPTTPLAGMRERGEFELPDRFRMLEELRTIVAQSEFSDCRFSSNHASNYLPLRSTLPRDKEMILEVLDEVIERRDPSLLKPESLRAL